MSVNCADVAVVGGGLIGIAIADALCSAGLHTTVIDEGVARAGASYGNAGLIVPSFAPPSVSCGLLLELAAAAARGNAPVTLSATAMLRSSAWLLASVANARPSNVDRQRADLAALGMRSRALYGELESQLNADIGLRRKGSLYVAASQHALADLEESARAMERVGVVSRAMQPDSARQAAPFLQEGIAGARFYPNDAHLAPEALRAALRDRAHAHGTRIVTGSATALLQRGGRICGVRLGADTVAAHRVVIATGWRLTELLRPLGIRLPVIAIRGFHLDLPPLPKSARADVPVILANDHVVITPFNDRARCTSGYGIGDVRTAFRIGDGRVIANALRRRCVAELQVESARAWVGFRPSTPDSLPIVGHVDGRDDLLVAGGHGSLGITLAPVTAAIVRDLLAGGTLSVPEAGALSPERFR